MYPYNFLKITKCNKLSLSLGGVSHEADTRPCRWENHVESNPVRLVALVNKCVFFRKIGLIQREIHWKEKTQFHIRKNLEKEKIELHSWCEAW